MQASTLETERLILRPLELTDAERTQELFPHWEVVKYLNASIPWPYPVDGARTYYRDVALPAMERGEEWHWTLRLRSSPEKHIGAVLLAARGMENRGCWLGLEWQARGLMTEALTAVTDFWFEVLGRPVMHVPKAAANRASRRLSEKTGMRLVRTVEREYVCGRLQADIWEITAEEWKQFRGSSSFRRLLPEGAMPA